MEIGDNALAGKILLRLSAHIAATMSTARAKQYVQSRYLEGMPDDPVWVDGAGLARYNLFSRRNMVFVLDKLYEEFPRERLFSLFAVGGRTGTLKNNYGGRTPYIYAKSGTLSNNYTLSGYLITNSGKTLIFSIMNNHYTKQNWQVRQETQKLLEYIRDNY